MKKIIFGLLLLSAFSATAAESTSIAIGTAHNRVSKSDGSFARLAVKNDSFNYGLQTETVANVSRNQIDASYSLIDYEGLSASIGLGAVSKTATKTHAVYLLGAGYTYGFTERFHTNIGMSYRNDFDHVILDRKTTANIGVNYGLTNKSNIGLNYARGYGDSKTNICTVSYSAKF